jgi:tetratricopeptide (TPR) repeat protein
MNVNQKAFRLIELLLMIVIVFICGWISYQRNSVWHTEISLWSDVIRKTPLDSRAHHHLGAALFKSGAIPQAIEEYRETLRLDPYNAAIHFNLGVSYQRMGLYDSAIEEYKKFLEFKERYSKSLYHDALEEYHRRLEPLFANAHNNLGVCYFMKGNIDDAVEEFRNALRLNPHLDDAIYNLELIQKKRESGFSRPP